MKVTKKYLKELQSLYNLKGSITGAAKEFAFIHNMVYSDSLRRQVSKLLNKNKPKLNELPAERKWEENAVKGTGYVEANTSKPVKTLEDAIATANVDLKKWSVERWIANSWGVTAFDNGKPIYRTNYQVKMWLIKRKPTMAEVVEKHILPAISNHPVTVSQEPGSGVGVVSFADFHIGASVKDLLRTPDFNVTILLDYIDQAVEYINQAGFDEVHVNLLGDFYESLSGMNHDNTFKSLGQDMWGANPIILAHKIISERLLGQITNLKAVNMISGNHDRMTASNILDNTGEGAKILWYMLQNTFPDLEIKYHNSVIATEIDGIFYLLTHGDKGFSKKDFSKFVLDYGSTDHFNVVIEGHLHSRTSKKVIGYERKIWEDVEYVTMDDSNYRKLVAPSLFTGNWFSESIGFGSSAGFIVTTNNGKDRINTLDICL